HTKFPKLPSSLSPPINDPTNRNLVELRKTKFSAFIVFIAFSVYLTHETFRSGRKTIFWRKFSQPSLHPILDPLQLAHDPRSKGLFVPIFDLFFHLLDQRRGHHDIAQCTINRDPILD